METKGLTQHQKDVIVIGTLKSISGLKNFFIHNDAKCERALRDTARSIHCDPGPEDMDEMLEDFKRHLKKAR